MDHAGMTVARAFSIAADAETVLVAAPALVELLPIGIYACDAAGRLRWFNQRAAALWGRLPAIGDDAERFCGSHKLYSLDGSLIRRDETPMAQALRSGDPVEGKETTVERPDGSRIIAMVHINPLKDANGNIIGAINCFHDVTETKTEERKLRESERQFRELLDALPAAIYTTDATGRISFYNEAAVELSGRRPKLGMDEWCVTWRLYQPDGTPLPHDRCPMAIALRENRPVRGVEAVAERPDGNRVPFLPYPTPLHDHFGNVIGAVNMLVDISHRKEAETQQRMLISELNHRTKNNLQMLHALLNAARRETANAEAKAVLADAIQRVSAMAAAQTVLYQANNARGFQARDFLGAVCGSARQVFGDAIRIECEASEGELSNDAAAPLALILNELLTNAAKHGINGRGEGTVKVSLTKGPNEMALRVEDDGPGFELSKTRRRASGLGLVMGLTRQIGGSFTVERGTGACCTVRFPDETRAC
jgi:PAS domain S-box-containing protein